MIYLGLDDTDIAGSPGTNQLARAIIKRLGPDARGAAIVRHQLFFDPAVPYTSKNGSASIQLPGRLARGITELTDEIRETMRGWFVEGSDPGLCVTTEVPSEITAFGARCQRELVTQEEARALALATGVHLEGLGGTEQGIIGALAAVGLIATGQDGRLVHLESWPYPDPLTGVQPAQAIHRRGIAEIRRLDTGTLVTDAPVDIGKHLRPNIRDGRIVLLVTRHPDPAIAPWQAVKLA